MFMSDHQIRHEFFIVRDGKLFLTQLSRAEEIKAWLLLHWPLLLLVLLLGAGLGVLVQQWLTKDKIEKISAEMLEDGFRQGVKDTLNRKECDLVDAITKLQDQNRKASSLMQQLWLMVKDANHGFRKMEELLNAKYKLDATQQENRKLKNQLRHKEQEIKKVKTPTTVIDKE